MKPRSQDLAEASTLTASKKDGHLVFALMTMTVVTGLVDAVSFLGLGSVFTANMTGNVVFLAFAVAGAPGLSIRRSLTSLIAFLIGAILGGRLAVAMVASSRRRWLVTSAVAEAGLLFAAALVSVRIDIGSRTASSGVYGAIILTAVAMGLRNATVRRLAVPDMTTTVLTLTLTGLAADSLLAAGSNPRIGRRVASVLLMFIGAAIGALLLRFSLPLPLVLSGALVLVAAAVFSTVLTPNPPADGSSPVMVNIEGEDIEHDCDRYISPLRPDRSSLSQS
jgi:uncharacterized membrane protein YoaK (UPF0700 family)